MAIIAINDMRFYAHHGCFEQERAIGTHFRVDLRFDTDTARAELSDNIADTVSYLDVYQIVKREMLQPSNLLEHVARRICDAVMLQFPEIKDVTAVVYKLNPPLGGNMESVSVEVSASRP
ncbi:MAG: dihydroneopterin aldolase [Bacteroidales bacterium]|nr:dihydroneopterin aldolase [Bacteroidales bacterium]